MQNSNIPMESISKNTTKLEIGQMALGEKSRKNTTTNSSQLDQMSDEGENREIAI